MTMMRTATTEQLFRYSMDLLTSAGANAESAEAASWAVLHASIHGVDSHGIRLLPWYAECLRSGRVNGTPEIRLEQVRRAAARLDADGGLGHLACYRAMDEACAIARDCGIGMVAVVRSTHFGAAGAYALAAADAGFIGMVLGNSVAYVVPHGGSVPIHGTNPIALAAPNPGGEPFLLDMATSSFPWNKVLRYRTEGLELPRGVAVDGSGQFVTDPHQAVALAPLGGEDFGYKGAGLAGVADILSGVLTGMNISTSLDRSALCDTDLGHFVMAIDPTLFMTLETFGSGVAAYMSAFAAQRGTMPAGGPEWTQRQIRQRDGIPIPAGLHADLARAASEAGIAFTL